MFFFFNDTATTEIYTLSLHDALPILTRDLGSSSFILNIINMMDVIKFITKTIGVIIKIKTFIILATARDTLSLLLEPRVLGVTSPNTSITIVIIAVDIATPCLPNIVNKRDVDIEVAAIFTTLFPTSIVLSSFLGSSVIFSTILAPLTPSSFKCLIIILLTDIKAVSDAEKKPDKTTNITKPTT